MSTVVKTVALQAANVPDLVVAAEAGVVTINGVRFLPHEANQLGDALHKAAWVAFEKANEARRAVAG